MNQLVPSVKSQNLFLKFLPQKSLVTPKALGTDGLVFTANTHMKGESGRSARTRTKEHVSSIRRGNPANPMVKHNSTMHPNAKPLFGIKILGAFKDPLSRQAEEGVRIYSANPNKIMNSKTEFHHPALKRISLIGSIRHHHSNSSKTSRK